SETQKNLGVHGGSWRPWQPIPTLHAATTQQARHNASVRPGTRRIQVEPRHSERVAVFANQCDEGFAGFPGEDVATRGLIFEEEIVVVRDEVLEVRVRVAGGIGDEAV